MFETVVNGILVEIPYTFLTRGEGRSGEAWEKALINYLKGKYGIEEITSTGGEVTA